MRPKNQRLLSCDLAGIQYAGLDGITESCLAAITCLFGRRELIANAALITAGQNHGFLISTEFEELIAIKAGFGSGYHGEGARGLATALQLLQRHNIGIEEYYVDQSFMERLSASCLLQSDIDTIKNQAPVRPRRWHDYVYAQMKHLDAEGNGLTRHYPLAMPFILIDERIIDLAVRFHGNEDSAIISAYRRLEDIFRKRTGLAGEGSKLFAKAFLSDDAPLRWDVPDEGESKGRANLFIAAYMAFRNARVHREMSADPKTALREFLLVNELYRLEAEAMTEAEIKEKKRSESELEEALNSLQVQRPKSRL